jgi:hypothetical protein
MLGKAAVAIWCDVESAIKEEFDDWHAHEHMPERLAIPGFLRGSRWESVDGRNACFVLYELESLAVLTAGPYLERLNNPTPWSKKIMPYHRNMVRSLSRVQASFGIGLGQAMLTIRFSSPAGADEKLVAWLSGLPALKGLVAAHLLRDAGPVQGAPTTEQRIRGGDQSADGIVLINGYDVDAVAQAAGKLNEGNAPGSIARIYRLAFTLGGKS